jgi:hypothetical protein
MSFKGRVKLNGAGGGIFRYYYGALQVDFSSSLGSLTIN